MKITINELACSILDVCGRSDLQPLYEDWTPGDIRIFDISNAKLCKLGFEFQTDFETGLARTIEWYRGATANPHGVNLAEDGGGE